MTPQLPNGPGPLVFDPGDEVADLVTEWVRRPALRSLVETFGGAWPTTTSLRRLLEELTEFSERWDLRAGASRFDLPIVDASSLPFSEVPSAADALGLVRQPLPSGEASDCILVLGGLATGTTSRIEYLSFLVERGLVRPSRGIVLLGSFRPLVAKEHEFLAVRHPELADARTEVELLERHLTSAIATGTEWVHEGSGTVGTDGRRAHLHAHRAGAPPQHVLAAASSDPERRAANTADTLEFAASELPLVAGCRIQLVTSAVYAVYQFFDAVRVLGSHQVSIEMLGVPPERSSRAQGPAAQLQEIRSCIRSALLLVTSTGAPRSP